MSAVETAPTYTNTDGYLEVNAAKLRLMSDRILVQWEYAKDEIKAGRLTLLRPETHKKAHYTGTILVCGPDVSDEIRPGMRIFFQQFAGFEKFFDPKYGRLALIREPDAEAVVPKRVNVSSMDGDYDYSR